MNVVWGWLGGWVRWLRSLAPRSGVAITTDGISCMGIEPRDLPAHLSRIDERSRSIGSDLVMSPAAREIFDRAIDPNTLDLNGRLTVPRTYGVYDVVGATVRFHFGNHPVRQQELTREHLSCRLVATFLERTDAEQLQLLLNDRS